MSLPQSAGRLELRLAVAVSVENDDDQMLAAMLKQNLAARGCFEVKTEFGEAFSSPSFAIIPSCGQAVGQSRPHPGFSLS